MTRLITTTLVGPRKKIVQVAQESELNIASFEIDDVPDAHAAAAKAVEEAKAGRTEVLMKGSLHTDELMADVVAAGTGLRTSRRISHAFVLALPNYPKPLIVTMRW